MDFWTRYIGRNVIRFYLPLSIRPPTDNHSQIVVMAKDLEARLRLEEALDTFLVETFPEAVVRVSPLEMGPPIGWPLQYRISGPDVEVLRTQALRLAEVVASHPGAQRVHFDWIEPARQLVIDVDQDQARRMGLTSAQLASVLQTAVSGTTVTQLRDDIYLVNVIARAEAARPRVARRACHAAGAGAGRADGGAQFLRDVQLHAGAAAHLAAGPGADADGAGRRGAGAAAGDGGGCARGRHRGAERRPALRLPDRGGRHRRDLGRKLGRGLRGRAAHDLPDAHAPDDPAQGLPAGGDRGRSSCRSVSSGWWGRFSCSTGRSASWRSSGSSR